MRALRGSVVHCGRFGCVVRLCDGRFAILPSGQEGMERVRRAVGVGRRPSFPFIITEEHGRRVRVSLGSQDPAAAQATSSAEGANAASSSLEEKIIEFWRQASDWDKNAARIEADETMRNRARRLLSFDERPPSRHREMTRRSRKGTKPTRRNR